MPMARTGNEGEDEMNLTHTDLSASKTDSLIAEFYFDDSRIPSVELRIGELGNTISVYSYRGSYLRHVREFADWLDHAEIKLPDATGVRVEFDSDAEMHEPGCSGNVDCHIIATVYDDGTVEFDSVTTRDNDDLQYALSCADEGRLTREAIEKAADMLDENGQHERASALLLKIGDHRKASDVPAQPRGEMRHV